MPLSASHSAALASPSATSFGSFVDELSALLAQPSLDGSAVRGQLAIPKDGEGTEQDEEGTASQLIARLCALRQPTLPSASSPPPLSSPSPSSSSSFPPLVSLFAASSLVPSADASSAAAAAAVRLSASECCVAVLHDELQAALSSARQSASLLADLSADCSTLRDQLQQLSQQARLQQQQQQQQQRQQQATAHSRSASSSSSSDSSTTVSAGRAGAVSPPSFVPVSASPAVAAAAAGQSRDSAGPAEMTSAVLSELQQRSAEIQHLLQVPIAPPLLLCGPLLAFSPHLWLCCAVLCCAVLCVAVRSVQVSVCSAVVQAGRSGAGLGDGKGQDAKNATDRGEVQESNGSMGGTGSRSDTRRHTSTSTRTHTLSH